MTVTDQPVVYTAPTLLEAQGMAMVNRERDRGRRVVLKVSARRRITDVPDASS